MTPVSVTGRPYGVDMDPDASISLPSIGIDGGVAAWPHHGRAAELVRELKYGRATAVVSELADRLAAISPTADLVTWVPASPARRRQRGFDQSELLARAVARRRRLPARRLLRRTDDAPQTARDVAGRLRGPSLIGVGRRLRLRPTVIVVDDVSTTGASLAAAAGVVRARGAGTIVGLVVTVAPSDSAVRHRPPAGSIV